MPDYSSSKILLFGYAVVTVLFFVGLFAYAKLGPGFPLSVNQITTTKSDLFTVTGEGKVTAVPDIAQVSLGFTTNGANVSQVQSQANGTINSITTAVKKLGVGEKDIQTSNYNLRPDYDYNANRQTIKGYVIDVNLSVKVRDFAKINQVIDAGTANGANQIGGLSFTLDDATREKLTSEARKIAIDQAKKKAGEIANAAGINLGRVINAVDNQTNYPRPIFETAKAAPMTDSGSEPTQIEPGSSEISVTVTLSYETR